MLVAIYQRKKPTLWPGGLSVPTPPPLEFDAAIRDSHDTEFAWTGSPIENGQFATDHGIELPPRLAMDVVLTSHPDEVIPNVVASRHIRLYRQLLQIARLRMPLDVVTSLAIYTSMVFDRISVPRTKLNTNALICTVQMHKIEIATVDVAQNLAEAAQEIALGEQDLGAVAASSQTAVAA